MTAELRPARESDAAAMLEIYAPFVRATATSFELQPPSVEEMQRRIASTLVARPWLVLCRGDQLAGYAYADAYRTRAAYQWAVEVTVYVHEERRHAGCGRALYTALLGILGDQGYRQAFAVIALPNPPSVRFHESMGFAPVGVCRSVGFKLGRWHDVGWWQKELPRDVATEPPAPPTPLAEFARGETLARRLAEGLSQLRP
jgi:L-amino acid N-acyltransferase YncA